MKRYPEYKDSGVEWIGEIPKDWNTVPLTKYLESIIDYRGRTPEKTERGRFLVTAKNIRNGQIDYEISQEFTSEDEYQRLMTRGRPKIGDVLFTTEAPLGEVANVDDVSIALAQRIIKFRPKSDLLNPYFLKYWLLSYSFQSDLQRYATGSTAQGIKASKLCLLKLNIPPLKEQTQIANFLDRKTEQIDELTRIKERQIQLLQEQRTALINQAVTKGLDLSVEMKPSGVEWIGEIPAHWRIIKLRYLGILQNGISKGSDAFGLGYPFLSYGDVYNNETLPLQVEGLVKSTKADRERYSVLERDIFFTRTSETIEDIGISSTCMKTIENCVFSGFLIRFRNTSQILTKELSKYYFSSHLPRIFLAREVNIVTRSSLSQESLKRLPVLLPPLSEQTQIANFLNHKTQQIDKLISTENQKIQLLKEYRQSLISEAVTGKIDVRNEP